MAIKTFQCDRHSPVSVIVTTMVGPGENMFKIKVLRKLDWILQYIT